MPVPDALLIGYRRRISVFRDAASGLLVARWDRLDDIREEQAVAFAAATARPLAGAKAAAVTLAAGFFAVALGVRPVGVGAADVDVEPDLRAPFLAAWHALKMGRPFDEAKLVGRSTAQAAGFDFVQRAARRTGDKVAERSGVDVRWRRRPGPKSCAWCREMAKHTWPTAEAADFGHERDDCDVVPA